MTGTDLVPMTQPQRQREGGVVRAWRFAARNRHVTVPVAVAPAMAGMGLVLHAAHLLAVTAAGGAVAVIAVLLLGPHKWARDTERWYAFTSAAGCALWLISAAWLGIPLPLGIILAIGVIAWGIPWWHHKRPRGRRKRDRLIARWDAFWQYHSHHWNLLGSRVIGVRERGVTTSLHVQLWGGRQSSQHVRSALHLIETALSGYVREGMIRVETDTRNPSQVWVHLKQENPLRGVVTYDDALNPESVTEPAFVGVLESGAHKRISLLQSMFIIGRTRSGKSNQLSVLLAAITGCLDARTWLIDRKGGRAARPWLPALDFPPAVTIDEARLLLRLGAAEVASRAMLAPGDEEQLTPAENTPAIFVVIDEANTVTSMTGGDTECARLAAIIASQGAGVAVYLIILTQYGSLEESVRTEQIRSNLPVRMVFQTERAEHGQFAMEEYARLDASKLEEKGTFYVKDGPKATPEQCRAPHMPHDLVRKIASRNGSLPRQPLRLYAAEWQEWYDARWQRLDEHFRGDSPQYQALAASQAPAAAVAPSQPQPAAPAAPPAGGDVPGWESPAEAARRIEDETARAHQGLPDELPPLRGDLGSEMDRRKAIFARALAAAPPEGISPKQLMAVSGMASSWVHQQLRALTEVGALTQLGRGRYAPVPGEDVAAAMALVAAANDQLLAEARAKVHAA